MHINTSAVVMFTFMLALPPRGLFYYKTFDIASPFAGCGKKLSRLYPLRKTASFPRKP
jgi:hypothetical protein